MFTEQFDLGAGKVVSLESEWMQRKGVEDLDRTGFWVSFGAWGGLSRGG